MVSTAITPISTQGRQLVPGTAATYTYRNLDKVKLWGLEASAEWQPARNWTLNTSAVYQRGKQLNSESDTAYVPFDDASPLSGVLGIKYDMPEYGLSTQLMGTFSQGVKRVSDEKRLQTGWISPYMTGISTGKLQQDLPCNRIGTEHLSTDAILKAQRLPWNCLSG